MHVFNVLGWAWSGFLLLLCQCLQVAVTLFPSLGGRLGFCQNGAFEMFSRHRSGTAQKADKAETKERAQNKPPFKWFIIPNDSWFPFNEWAFFFFFLLYSFVITVWENIHGGSSSRVKAGCGRGSKTMWRRSTWVYLRLGALKVRNVLGPWNKGTKPGTITSHQLFHSFFARTGKNPKLHVAGANFQEGKAQKNPLVVCFYQRIPQFDTPWKCRAITDHVVKG